MEEQFVYFAKDFDGRTFLYTSEPVWNAKNKCFMVSDGRYMIVPAAMAPKMDVGEMVKFVLKRVE